MRPTLAELLPPDGRAAVVVGGMVSYERTPVGEYHEVFGGVVLLDGRDLSVSIPFMAVDSRDSVGTSAQS